MILLDTVVVSEFRKARPSPAAVSWLHEQREDNLLISVVTLGEIERGIALAKDELFRTRLQRWLEDTMRRFADRVIDITPEVARLWGRWSATHGHATPDVFIAATAEVHDLTVATRNVAHFTRFGVRIVDPFR